MWSKSTRFIPSIPLFKTHMNIYPLVVNHLDPVYVLKGRKRLRETKRQTPLEKNSEPHARPAEQAFQRSLHFTTEAERKVAELQRDLHPLRQAGQLTNQPEWRTFLARTNEQIRAIPHEQFKITPEQAHLRAQAWTEKAAADLQQLKAQATTDFNRHIRTLQYEGVRGIPPEITPHSEPASLDPRETPLIQNYNLDLPSSRQPSDYLDTLKTRIETQKPDIPGATSQKAQRLRWARNEQIETHNRWTERFEMPENQKLPEDRLKGGIYLHEGSFNRLHARFVRLIDPTGGLHIFNAGETSSDIADYTAGWVNQWVTQHRTTRMTVHGGFIQVEALTREDVNNLQNRTIRKNWLCLENRFVQVQARLVYTDAQRPIYAVRNVPYRTRPNIPGSFQGIALDRAGQHTDCYGRTFLEGRGRLWANSDDMQAILDDNGYFQVDYTQAKQGDICIYTDTVGIAHAAPVLGWDQDVNNMLHSPGAILPERPQQNQGYHLMAVSKLGDSYEVGHIWDDPGIQEWYGAPQIYRTDRPGGNTLTGA